MSQMTELGGALNWDKVDRLHKALRVGGVSVKQMAAELGVHRNTVGNYLRGTSEPDRRTLVTWALACGVPFAWLDEGASIESGPDGDGGVAITDAGRSPTVALGTLLNFAVGRTMDPRSVTVPLYTQQEAA